MPRRPERGRLVALTAFALVLASAPASAQEFRYIDRDGRAHVITAKVEAQSTESIDLDLAPPTVVTAPTPRFAAAPAFAALPAATTETLAREPTDPRADRAPAAAPGENRKHADDFVARTIARAAEWDVEVVVEAPTRRQAELPTARAALAFVAPELPSRGPRSRAHGARPAREAAPTRAAAAPAAWVAASHAGWAAARPASWSPLGPPARPAFTRASLTYRDPLAATATIRRHREPPHGLVTGGAPALLLAAATGVSTSGRAPVPEPVEELAPPHAATIREAAVMAGVPIELLFGVVQVESNFDRGAISSAGARGLTQLMPGTWRELGVSDPFDARENAIGGARHLRRMIDLHQGKIRLALAAYHAGSEAVRRAGGRAPTLVTRLYVDAVLDAYLGYVTRPPAWLARASALPSLPSVGAW